MITMWKKKNQDKHIEMNYDARNRSSGSTAGGSRTCAVRDPAPGASSAGSTPGAPRSTAKDQLSLDATASCRDGRYRLSFGPSLRRGGTTCGYASAGTVVPYLKTFPLTALTAILSRSARLFSIAGWGQLTHLVCPKRQESSSHQDSAPRPGRPARFTLAAFALLLLAAVALAAGCGIGSGEEETENGAGDAIAVEVQAVERGDLAEEVEISGSIDSDGNVSLVPQVNGSVAHIAASVGDRVESGQVLLELENEDIATQLRQAESRLQQARLQIDTAREVQMPRQIDRLESELEQLAEGLRQAESQLESTRKLGTEKLREQLGRQLNEAQIYYDEVKRSFERSEQLYQAEIISQADYERAETEYKSASSRLESAREMLRLEEESLEKEIEALESQVRQMRTQYESASRQLEMERISQGREKTLLEAQLQEAEIGLEGARIAYEKTRLKAPVSGTVSSMTARLGQEVSPGMPLVTLVDYDTLYVKAQITERQLELIAEGDNVSIQVPTLGEEFPGTVREIALTPQEGTRSYPVKVYFDQPAEAVRIGQLANLFLVVQEAREVLVIPRRAVIAEDDVFRAYVVENGVAWERLLELGLVREDFVEVLSGLQEGERLIIRGQQFIEDGTPVQIVGGEAS